MSALLSAGTPGRAEALFGRGKTPEAPPVPALEQRLQDGAEALEGASEELTDAAEGLGAVSSVASAVTYLGFRLETASLIAIEGCGE